MTSDTVVEGEEAPRARAPERCLEFDLPPAAVAPLLRHRALKTRLGRMRRAPLDLVWSDTAEGDLAEADCLLETEAGAGRRLVRLLPSAPLPAEAESLEGEGLPKVVGEAGLLPRAAFSGERRLLAVSHEGAAVELEVRQGLLRCVAAEAPAARLLLRGEAGACLALAQALAAELPLLPPRAGLAEAGRALSMSEDVRPRRKGAVDLAEAERVGEAIERTLAHLLEVLVFQAGKARPGQGPEGVHQMRVAARRARSVLKVFRPVADAPLLRAIDQGLGQLARALGPARDWDVFIGGLLAELHETLGDDRRLTQLAQKAAGRQAAGYAALRLHLESPAYRRLLLDMLAGSLGAWRAEAAMPEMLEAPLEPFAAAVLSKRWRRLVRDAAEIEDLPDEALHALRLKGKRLRYAAELFAALWPGKTTRRFLRRLAALQEALGIANDTAVARGLAAALDGKGNAWACGLVEGWALARGRRARKAAIEAWHGFEKAERFWEPG